ncbi:MAG: hypothetical protein V3U52_04055 [Thermoplasmata archaeon]|jgi:hypothetical protein
MESKTVRLEDMKIVCHCGGETEQVRTHWRGIPVRAWRCRKCGEEMIHPSDAQRALVIARAIDRGEFRVKVRQVGKSLTLTIPRKLVEAYGLEVGEIAEWGVESEDRFVIRIAD